MSTIEETTDVNVPVSTAYNQWTQFEEFPNFMEGVEKVIQVDDKRLHWVAEIAGQHREWDAEITEQRPDERIAWTSTSGPRNAGLVTFQRLVEGTTRVTMQLDFEPDDAMEKTGDALGMVGRQARRDMERFKEFIESRGRESGAWRGEID